MESIELLLQIVVDESSSASGLEKDAAAWVRGVKHRKTLKNTKMQMLKCGVLPCVLTVGAISAEGPGVQQTAGRLEQVRTLSSTCLLDYNPDKKEIKIVSCTN